MHAAQRHRGTEPRFLAQPPLELKQPLQIEGKDSGYSPVERAAEGPRAQGTAGAFLTTYLHGLFRR